MVRIEERIQIAAPVERFFDLARCVEVHLLGAEQTGEQAVGGTTTGLLGPGHFIQWRATHFGIRQHLTSSMTAFERPLYFQDTMIEGAFCSMQHDHFFVELGPSLTEMKDVLRFSAPLPVLGPLAEALVLRRYMRNFLRRRNEVLKEVAESEQLWTRFLPKRG